MDVRRVQITGGSSFMITLPKEWANAVGLNKNDTVGLQAQPDGTLSLYPKGTAPIPKRSTKVIDATNMMDRGFLYRQLVGAYIAGHSTMLIKSAQPMSSMVTSAVTNFVQTAVGLEMIEADDSHILVANLIEHDAIDPKKIIERMGLLVKSMIFDLYEAAYTGNYENIKDMRSRDMEIDRIYWLTSRQCNIYQKDAAASHKINLPLSEMTACLSMSRVLEGIGDYVITMSDYLIFIGKCGDVDNIDKDAHMFGLKINNLLAKAVKSWIEKDIALAEQSIKEADEMIRGTDMASRPNLAATSICASANEVIMFSSKRLSEYCKEIAVFAFNMAME
ncbi:MAG: phosphate uptake regulator PhoU [Candidatus Methanoplasma sp.]|nr:phosphate uptake regulator PhoU [Candidatus Methanoplasma sp.]